MKKVTKKLGLMITLMLFAGFAGFAQTATVTPTSQAGSLHTYVIERDIPGAGSFSAEKLKQISQTSCTVLKAMGPSIQWIHSYVTADKIFCIYKAENIDLVKEHAKRGGFPVNAVYEVDNIISPATANQ